MKSTKIDNDKYYTPIDLAKECINKTFEIIGRENITEIIEPSAGNGSFSNQIENCIAYDLVPENENINQANFLGLKLKYKIGRLFIGNPPFGVHSKLAIDFYNKCCYYGDYIAFILPISFYKNDIRFHLVTLLGLYIFGEMLIILSSHVRRKEVELKTEAIVSTYKN